MNEVEGRPGLLARRLTRRRMLRAALLSGAGLAGIAIVGCGSDEKVAPLTSAPGVTPTEGPSIELLTPEPGLARLGWVQLEPSGEQPSPRVLHSLVWDDTTGEACLFGGSSAATPLNDLWALDVERQAWRQVRPAGQLPPARFGHNAVFDPGEGRTLVFAGQAGEAFFNDLWAFSSGNNSWAEITTAAPMPAPRVGAGAALDGEAGRLYVTHGLSAQGYLDDTWAMNLATGTWEDLSPSAARPPKRSYLRTVWDTSSGRLLLFGGESHETPLLGDLWSFDPAGRVWEEIPPDGESPPARTRFGAVYVPEREWLLIFGGAGEGGNLRDLWFYVPSAAGWGSMRTLSRNLGARRSLDMTYVPNRRSVIVFGGVRAEQEIQEVWELGIGSL